MKILWDNLFRKNPVFVLMLGLVPAVAATTTAFNGWALGLITACIFVLATALEYFLTPLLPENSREIFKAAVLIALTVLAYAWLLQQKPQIVAELGIFLPLLAFNGMLWQSAKEKGSFGQALLDSATQGLGFILALVLIGMIREFAAFGTVFGLQAVKASLPPLAVAGGVPGGLIVVGLLMALAANFTERGGKSHD